MAENYLELATQIQQLSNADDMDPQALKDTLDSMEAALGDKLEAINWVIQDAERDLGSINVDVDRMKAAQKQQKRLKKRVKNLKRYMTVLIDATGKDKVRTGKHVFRSYWPSYSLKINDETKLPSEFVQKDVVYSPKKDEIKAAIKAGQKVPGAEVITTKRLQVF